VTGATIRSCDGTFTAWFSHKGLAALSFPDACPALHEPAGAPGEWGRLTAEALNAVLSGKPPTHLPSLDLSHGTDFQQRVWKALLTIGPGETCSYGELAALIGIPGAARAVGAACGANRIPVLIPCHRVLAANRRIGGFSAGLNWKRLLLEREGVALISSKKRFSGLTQDRRWRNRQLTLGKRFADKLDQRRLDGFE
jgi:O-6-methylguanine DNA methyltransferase